MQAIKHLAEMLGALFCMMGNSIDIKAESILEGLDGIIY